MPLRMKLSVKYCEFQHCQRRNVRIVCSYSGCRTPREITRFELTVRGSRAGILLVDCEQSLRCPAADARKSFISTAAIWRICSSIGSTNCCSPLSRDDCCYRSSTWQSDRTACEATAQGETLDERRHVLEHEVKAITYHGLRVEKTNGDWIAEVILDI